MSRCIHSAGRQFPAASRKSRRAVTGPSCSMTPVRSLIFIAVLQSTRPQTRQPQTVACTASLSLMATVIAKQLPRLRSIAEGHPVYSVIVFSVADKSTNVKQTSAFTQYDWRMFMCRTSTPAVRQGPTSWRVLRCRKARKPRYAAALSINLSLSIP